MSRTWPQRLLPGRSYALVYGCVMRLLHRYELCWTQPLPLRDGAHGQWVNVWCHWCGVRGKRLDLSRACAPGCDHSVLPVDSERADETTQNNPSETGTA